MTFCVDGARGDSTPPLLPSSLSPAVFLARSVYSYIRPERERLLLKIDPGVKEGGQ